MGKRKIFPGGLPGPALAAWLLLAGFPTQAAEECLKLVFDQYCLGGDINLLMRQNTGMVHKQSEGERLAVIYPEGRDLAYVLGYKGRIYKVGRKFATETHMKRQVRSVHRPQSVSRLRSQPGQQDWRHSPR